MGFEHYHRRRDFHRTPKPEGEVGRKGGERVFVVRAHDARAMRYDFRLELDGVLLSWAV